MESTNWQANSAKTAHHVAHRVQMHWTVFSGKKTAVPKLIARMLVDKIQRRGERKRGDRKRWKECVRQRERKRERECVCVRKMESSNGFRGGILASAEHSCFINTGGV